MKTTRLAFTAYGRTRRQAAARAWHILDALFAKDETPDITIFYVTPRKYGTWEAYVDVAPPTKRPR